MDLEQENHLINQTLDISFSFISEISKDNVVYSLDFNDKIVPDAVINHHLIDLLSELNPRIFSHYCHSLLSWLSDPANAYSDHPFTLDSYTLFCLRNEDNNLLFQSVIVNNQSKDGSIPIYTALFQGGDFFSTLWAVKILINYDKDLFSDSIDKAITYLISKKDIGARNNSQLGFLLYILLLYKPDDYKILIEELGDIIYNKVLSSTYNDNVVECINVIYLVEDLIKYYLYCPSEKIGELIKDKILSLFELDSDNKSPKVFNKFIDSKPQSPFYQLILKAAVISTKYLKIFDGINLAYELNGRLQLDLRENKYLRNIFERELIEYKKHYDDISKEFKEYDSALKEMWEKSGSDYEHSIFIMMPFKSEYNFRGLTKCIKDACLAKGYKAFRVDDKLRKPFDTLWDNIVINMLGCKYGISIYVSEKTYDKLSDDLKFFENPNVALEYGFMKSRGKKILILKDINSGTPADLKGFLWKPFDIENPDISVPSPINEWLDEL